MMSDRKNKVVTVAAWVAAVLVVACAEGDGSGDAIAKFCGGTRYTETCMKSVAKANSTEPKELIKATFNAAVEELQRVIKGTGVYKKLRSDKSTQGALAVCEMTLNRAIDDIRMSFLKLDKMNVGKVEHNIAHIRNWLSATTAHRGACIDAFDNTTGDTGKKVRQMLIASNELLSNSLRLVTQIQEALSSFDNLGLGEIANKIKKRELEEEELIPEHARKLMDGTPETLPPKVTVAQDGSGDCTTINEAIQRLGVRNSERVVIKVKAGVYEEYVMIPKGLNNLYMIGDGPLNTIITGKRSYNGGYKTFVSGTVQVDGDGFMAKDITFENTAPVSQAVAIRVTSRLAVFYRCHFKGFQDTLYPHSYMQFYRECRISGTVDFTFGDAKAVFQKCEFVARKHPGNGAIMVTAQGRENLDSDGAYVIQDCTITADDDFLNAHPPQQAYLGRPWKMYARVIVMQSDIGACIQPVGWFPMDGHKDYVNTLYYAEWGNRGDGKDLSKRPKDWGGYKANYTKEQAEAWLPQNLYKDDSWVRQSGVPYDPGFMVVPDDDDTPTPPTPFPDQATTDEKHTVDASKEHKRTTAPKKHKHTAPKKHTEDL